ncbi:MAG TPA: hypothetical protein VEY30_11790 [Myxococcaceae bacterium]|nr:hypothetical protein [Myxococcaceae bacterium]
MAEIIDLTLVSTARRMMHKMLDRHGISYFLQKDGGRLFHIEQKKVDLVIRAAARTRPPDSPRLPSPAVDYCRREIRRELIRRVVEAMLQTGL